MEFILLFAVSLDLFFVCLSYRLRGIKIFPASAVVLSAVSTAYLAAAAAVGFFLRQMVSPPVFAWFGFAVLLLLGCANILEGPIQSLGKRRRPRKLHLHLAKVHLVFEIYLDKTKADQDGSKSLTPYEAIFLALPLSLDCFITGLSFSFSHPLWLLLPYMFGISLLLCFLGLCLASRLPVRESRYSSLISGCILFILAFWRLPY